jgi:hypothetical protein
VRTVEVEVRPAVLLNWIESSSSSVVIAQLQLHVASSL